MNLKSIRRSLARAVGHQTIFARGKERIVKALSPASDGFSFSVPFYGYNYKGHTGNYIDWQVYFFGAYERAALSFLSRILVDLRRERGSVCSVDVGANVGHHSLFFAHYSDAVYAFEPWKFVFDRLQAKLADNGITHVKAFNFGLGAVDAMLPFHEPDPRHGNFGWGHFMRDADPIRSDPRLEVRHGDPFFNQEVPAPLSLLKLDVEGFEKDVLTGLRSRILRDRPVIFMEFSNPKDFDSEEEFRSLIYPKNRIFEMSVRDVEFSLEPWSFGASDALVIVPEEALTSFSTGLFSERSAAQPRPAPPIARCSTRATRRKICRGSRRRWMKSQWQVTASTS